MHVVRFNERRCTNYTGYSIEWKIIIKLTYVLEESARDSEPHKIPGKDKNTYIEQINSFMYHG